jgi:hypothetical protein
MNENLFLSGYAVLLLSVIIGAINYRRFNKSVRIVLLLLAMGLCSEMLAYVAVLKGKIIIKDITYHIYSIVEIILIGMFFIEAVKPYHHRKLKIVNLIVWPAMGIANIVFLQPVKSLNTNFLMLESFCIITMSLYFIYWSLKKNDKNNLFRSPGFLIALLWLVYWSGTFFFWAFIKILNGDKWPYINEAIAALGILVIITYCGFLLTFLLHPKKTGNIESH